MSGSIGSTGVIGVIGVIARQSISGASNRWLGIGFEAPRAPRREWARRVGVAGGESSRPSSGACVGRARSAPRELSRRHCLSVAAQPRSEFGGGPTHASSAGQSARSADPRKLSPWRCPPALPRAAAGMSRVQRCPCRGPCSPPPAAPRFAFRCDAQRRPRARPPTQRNTISGPSSRSHASTSGSGQRQAASRPALPSRGFHCCSTQRRAPAVFSVTASFASVSSGCSAGW